MRMMGNWKVFVAYTLVFILCIQTRMLDEVVKKVYGEEDETWYYGETVKYGDWKCVVEGQTVAIAGYTGSEAKLNIPSSIAGRKVIRIDTMAFNKSKNLTAITIPDSVTSIGGGAFSGCINLSTIEIPNSVTNIGGGAFYYCSNLKSVTLPKYLTNIQKCLFDGCGGLTSIIIPDNVINIGECAFRNCTNLTEISMSKNVINIGKQAFKECKNLTGVDIPDSVVSIGASAFSCCSSLSDIAIPNSVTNIDGGAFGETLWLKKKRKENPIVICNGILIDGSECSGEVIIPDGVVEVGASAFSYCRNLTSIVISDSVTSIGDYAFNECSNLESVIMSDKLTIIGGNAFYNCSKLAGIMIPDSVTSIGDYAFSNCSSLTSVTIPDSVTDIGALSFNGCNSLADITISDNVTSIKEHAFSGTPWLENMQKENPLVICNSILIDGSTCSANVIIPDNVTSIGNSAFSGCENLTNVIIPDGVTSIGDGAFSRCINLTSVTIPDSVTDIGGYAFDDTSWLKNKQEENPLVICNNILINGSTCSGDVVIPQGVISIGNSAFSENKGLTNITIPNSVISIGDGAFYHCENLTNVIMSNNITDIGIQAFYGCTGLMFYNCNGLFSMMIPDSVNNIGYHAFSNGSPYTCLTVIVSRGSYAEKYAKENNVDYMYIDNKATDITINPIVTQLKTGESLLLTPNITPDNVSIQRMIWSSEDSSIAKVDSNGMVTAISEGETTITAKTMDGSNLSAACKIKVENTDKDTTIDDNTTQKADTGSNIDTAAQSGTTQVTSSDNEGQNEQQIIPKVAKVTKFKVIAQKKRFKLSWKKVSGAKGYELQISTKKSFKGAKSYTIKSNKTKYTLSKLKRKKKYYVRIRAIKTYKDAQNKTKTVYGSWATKSKKTK